MIGMHEIQHVFSQNFAGIRNAQQGHASFIYEDNSSLAMNDNGIGKKFNETPVGCFALAKCFNSVRFSINIQISTLRNQIRLAHFSEFTQTSDPRMKSSVRLCRRNSREAFQSHSPLSHDLSFTLMSLYMSTKLSGRRPCTSPNPRTSSKYYDLRNVICGRVSPLRLRAAHFE